MDSIGACISAVLMLSLVVVLLILSVLIRALHAKEYATPHFTALATRARRLLCGADADRL